jgi:SOS response regulatory protein OraA/RecX
MVSAEPCTGKNKKENHIMKTPGIYYGVIAAFCVLTLCIGMVNATDLTQSATNCTGRPSFGHGHPPSPNEMITHLEQQGVDVTEVKPLLQNGDSDAVKAWLDAYRESHKDQMPNSTSRPGPEKIIERLEQQGVDVTEVKTALQNGDTATVKTWFDTYREAHKDQMPNSTSRPGPEKIIERLEQQGVDVTEVKTALQNGDTATVKTWFDTYREAHKDQMPNSTSRPGPEKIIERLEQQGVDVTEVKPLLQNGDSDAVKAWLDAYRESHKDQMKDFRMKGNLHAQAAP